METEKKELGLALILLSIATAILVYGPILYKRTTFQAPVTATKESIQVESVDREFGLVVPSLKVNVPVVPDLDGSSKDKYEKELADKGAGHLLGSRKPNEEGNTVIFGHSSSFTSGKYSYLLVNMDRLKTGDNIYVYYKNVVYEYKVSEIKEVDKTLTETVQNTDDRRLTLFTCWPPGTDLKRLVVVAKISTIYYP